MSRRSLKDHYIRNIQKTSGNSTYMITLPKDLVQELSWIKGQKVVVERYGKGLLIKDWSE